MIKKRAYDLLRELPSTSHYPEIRNKFSYAERRKIINDFHEELYPEFDYNKSIKKIGRSVSFYKLAGPLLMHFSIGIPYTSFYQANYKYIFSLYNLCYPIKRQILNLSFIRTEICWFEHASGHYKLIPQYIREESFIPAFSSPCLDDIFLGYRNNFRDLANTIQETGRKDLIALASDIKVKEGRELLYSFRNGGAGNDIYGHPAVIAAWAGEKAKAKEYLEWGYDIMQSLYHPELGGRAIDNYLTENRYKEESKKTKLYKEIMNLQNIPSKSKKIEESTISEFNMILDYIEPNILEFMKKNYKRILKEWYDKHKKMIDNPESLRQQVRYHVKNGDPDPRLEREDFKFAPYRDLKDVAYKETMLPNPKIDELIKK